jgi:hypothetical protein
MAIPAMRVERDLAFVLVGSSDSGERERDQTSRGKHEP